MRLPAILLVRLVLLERAVSFLTPASLELQHRFLPFPSSASGSEPSWQPLGSAAVNEELTASRMEKYTGHEGKELGRDWDMDDGKGWYQVGVESEGEWVIASTRACLLSSSAPSLVLQMTDSHLTSMSLQTINSRCSNSSVQLPSSNALWDIQIQRPVRISSPSSSTPAPAADPTTGLPIQPTPEKSFLAKWWMPLLGLALFAAGQLGSSEAAPAAAK